MLWRLCIGEMGAGESFEGGGDSAIAAFEAEGLGLLGGVAWRVDVESRGGVSNK